MSLFKVLSESNFYVIKLCIIVLSYAYIFQQIKVAHEIGKLDLYLPNTDESYLEKMDEV